VPEAELVDPRARRALNRAIVGTLALGAGKAVAAGLTGSTALAASAADSITDGAITAANRWMLITAAQPADPGHPYGHGKAEALASLAQAVILGGVIAGITWRAVSHLVTPVEAPDAVPALGVVLASLVGSALLARSLRRAADATGSLVLRADAAHYQMDLASGAAVVVGLGLGTLTGSAIPDSLAALVVSGLMAREVWRIGQDAVGELMDQALPPDEQARLETVLASMPLRGWHDLRTRRSGPHRFVQVHVELDPGLTLGEAHAVADGVEAALRQAVPGCDPIVHVDVDAGG